MKNIYISIFLLVALFVSNHTYGQIGGDNTYDFLNLSYSSREAGLGNNFLPVKDNDINVAVSNPSIITEDMGGRLSFSFIDYYASINYGYTAYAHSFNQIGTYVGSIQFVNYGEIQQTNEEGLDVGTFSAGDYILNIGWGRALDSNFSIGANFKTIYSHIETYNSVGLGVDIAATYHHAGKYFNASLILRNIGRQITTYTHDNPEALPFEIQLGMSKRFAHLPFRFYIMLTHLEKWDLTYYDPLDPDNQIDPFSGKPSQKEGLEDFGDKAFRHVVLGGELNLSKNFAVRLGYNYKRRQELLLPSKPATVGFSWGLNLKVSKFKIGFSRSAYHITGSKNFFTVTTDIKSF